MKEPFETRWFGTGVGGSPAVDFVNTLDWRRRERPEENLKSYADLLRWSWSAELLTSAETRRLLDWARRHPRAALRELAQAIQFREALARLFEDLRRGARLQEPALALLNECLREGAQSRGLESLGRQAAWRWRDDPPSPRRPIWAVGADAARVLTGAESDHIRQCDDFECGWFFLDTSRNRNRRWCTMETCGNRNKARSFYRRSRKQARKET